MSPFLMKLIYHRQLANIIFLLIVISGAFCWYDSLESPLGLLFSEYLDWKEKSFHDIEQLTCAERRWWKPKITNRLLSNTKICPVLLHTLCIPTCRSETKVKSWHFGVFHKLLSNLLQKSLSFFAKLHSRFCCGVDSIDESEIFLGIF